MSCGKKHNPISHAFYHIKEWDKKKIEWLKKKFNLTDYQVVCITFVKGFIIGAILL